MSKVKKNKAKFQGKIEPLINSTPFYMVVVQGAFYPPEKQHETYEDAFNECLRLSKKENKKAFVMLSVSQVEQIPNVTQFKFNENV